MVENLIKRANWESWVVYVSSRLIIPRSFPMIFSLTPIVWVLFVGTPSAFGQEGPGFGPPMMMGPPGGRGGFGPFGGFGEGGPPMFVRPEGMQGGPPWMQNRGFPFPGGGAPGGGPPGAGGPGRSEGDRSSRYEGFLRSLDANQDGIIDPREVPEDRRRFLGFAASRAGLDPSQPIPISRALESMRSRSGSSDSRGQSGSGSSGDSGRSGQSGSGSSGQSSASTPQTPLVPGFGVPEGMPAVPGFADNALAMTPTSRFLVNSSSAQSSRGGSSRSSSSSSGSRDSDREQRSREFAEGLLRRYDSNRSGRLEREEWSQIRGDPQEIDRNRDGVITLDELAARVASFGERRDGPAGPPGMPGGPFSAPGGPFGPPGGPPPGTGGGSSASGATSGSSPSSSSAPSGGSKFVRFKRPHERLPSGLPSWFIEKDKDEDGQILMSEFTTDWSDSRVAEFLRYDLNNDGMITPDEVLKAPQVASTPIGPSTASGGTTPPAASGGVSQPITSERSSSTSSSGSRSGRSAWDDPGSNFW